MANIPDPPRPHGVGSPAAPSRPRVDPMALIGEGSATSMPSPQQARPATAAARVAPKAAAPAAVMGKPVTAARPATAATAVRAAPAGAAGVATLVAPAVSVPVAVATRPAPKSSRRTLLFAGVGVGVVLLVTVAIGWLMLKSGAAVEGPGLNEDPGTVAKFAVGPDFSRLPFEQQAAYMQVLEDHEDQVDAAYAAGKLTDTEYRKALQLAYLGKHLGRATKYAALPPGKEREAYLDKHLKKKGKNEDGDDDAKPAASGGIKPLPKAPGAKDPVKIKRDESNQEVQIAAWPTEMREKWVAYRLALADRKDYLKDASKARDRAEKSERARAATQAAK